MRIQKILLPVDDSEHSALACRYAVEISIKTGAAVIILHCHEEVELRLMEDGAKEVLDPIIDESNKILASYADMMKKAGVNCSCRSVKGSPGDQIPWVARQEKSDLVIMGSKGRSNLAGIVIGSVTHKVLEQSPCPILVVR